MAVTPLTVSQRNQLTLHINDIRNIAVSIDERPSDWKACECANEGLALFEERAGGFPRTGINICINGDATLTVAEAAALAGQVNAITAVVEGGDGVAADVANEILELLEERVIATFIHERDVTQEQLP